VHTVIIILVSVVIGSGYYYYSGEDDSPIEEVAEHVIEQQIGLPSGSIDLSPSSKE